MTMNLIDLLPARGPLPAHVAETWVAAALAKAAALKELDDQLYPSGDNPAEMAYARQLHDAWRQWAQEAEALLRRIAADGVAAGARPDVRQLRIEAAFALALLEQSPEMILQRARHATTCDITTIEEVRRGLRARHRP